MGAGRSIYNYPIDLDSRTEYLFNIPRYFEILSVVFEYGRPCIFISVFPHEETITKKFTLVKTGEFISSEFWGSNRFVGSFHAEDTLGGTTYHLFMEY